MYAGTANPDEWGSLGTGMVNKEKLMRLTSPGSDFYKSVGFYYYVQYQLHLQVHSLLHDKTDLLCMIRDLLYITYCIS